jgi:hypothetical protein
MATKPQLTPLEVFDARIVQTPLRGLLRNMDGSLGRLLAQAMAARDPEAERKLSLLLMMLRFTQNSYEAISFLCSDEDDAPKRKREFVLILAPTNRQLLDLLFTLVFMLDDFPPRSMAYERSGYRQLREEYDKFYGKFGTEPKWQTHFADLREFQQTMEKYVSVTPEQKADPTIISYWQGPYKLMQKPTKSQPYLEHLERWLYGETSAQAHLNAAGLFTVAGFVISDLAPDDQQKAIMGRNLEKYKFRHFSRFLITVLAIASEIDTFCQLNNRETLSHLWVLLGGYAPEADEVYKLRYQAMLT